MRLTAFFYYALIVFGIAGVGASQFGGAVVPRNFFHFGLGLIGIGIALGGLESFLQRRVGFRLSDDGYSDYDGFPAMIIGLMTLFIGAAIVGAAYLLAQGRWHALVEALLRRPGPILIAAGFLFAGTGALFLVNPGGRSGLVWTLFVRAPKIVLGLALLVSGFALVGMGGWEFVQPQAFDRFVRTMPPPLVWLAH